VRRRFYDIAFTVALFALYTTIALVLVAIGARVYLHASETLTSNYNERTSTLYVAQRIRQNDSYDQIRVDKIVGSDALVFSKVVGERVFETWLYVYEGQLCELTIAAELGVDASYGQAIMPMQSMTIDLLSLEDGLISITFVMDDGQTTSIDVYVKTRVEVGSM